MYMHTYIYIYTHTYKSSCLYIYIYICLGAGLLGLRGTPAGCSTVEALGTPQGAIYTNTIISV